MNCKNCNRELKRGERELAEKDGTTECAECKFHTMNGTRTIEKYNEWLRKPITPAQIAIVKPEWDLMQDFLNKGL